MIINLMWNSRHNPDIVLREFATFEKKWVPFKVQKYSEKTTPQVKQHGIRSYLPHVY